MLSGFPMPIASDRSYRDLPAIAGICSVEDAAKIGHSIAWPNRSEASDPLAV